jgi:hypothetical protein
MSLAQEIGKHLPYFAQGPIVKGFGRGSKQLGRSDKRNKCGKAVTEKLGTGHPYDQCDFIQTFSYLYFPPGFTWNCVYFLLLFLSPPPFFIIFLRVTDELNLLFLNRNMDPPAVISSQITEVLTLLQAFRRPTSPRR